MSLQLARYAHDISYITIRFWDVKRQYKETESVCYWQVVISFWHVVVVLQTLGGSIGRLNLSRWQEETGTGKGGQTVVTETRAGQFTALQLDRKAAVVTYTLHLRGNHGHVFHVQDQSMYEQLRESLTRWAQALNDQQRQCFTFCE